MPDETSTPPADTQTPQSEPVAPQPSEQVPAPEPVIETPAEPEPPSQSEDGTGEPLPLAEAIPVPAEEPRAETQNPPAPQTEPPPPHQSELGTGHALGKEELEHTTTSQSPPRPPEDGSALGGKGGEVKRGDLAVARAKIQDTKRKKLDRIMALLEKKKNGSTGSPQVTNDEVEKLLHVSDATATRYLQTLEKENRVKQTGKTGTAVFYEPQQ